MLLAAASSPTKVNPNDYIRIVGHLNARVVYKATQGGYLCKRRKNNKQKQVLILCNRFYFIAFNDIKIRNAFLCTLRGTFLK
jgi:hypothetical protein